MELFRRDHTMKRPIKNFAGIIEYWQNSTKDKMCYNCSYLFVGGFCPCKIEHIQKEIEIEGLIGHTKRCIELNDHSIKEVCVC